MSLGAAQGANLLASYLHVSDVIFLSHVASTYDLDHRMQAAALHIHALHGAALQLAHSASKQARKQAPVHIIQENGKHLHLHPSTHFCAYEFVPTRGAIMCTVPSLQDCSECTSFPISLAFEGVHGPPGLQVFFFVCCYLAGSSRMAQWFVALHFFVSNQLLHEVCM